MCVVAIDSVPRAVLVQVRGHRTQALDFRQRARRVLQHARAFGRDPREAAPFAHEQVETQLLFQLLQGARLIAGCEVPSAVAALVTDSPLRATASAYWS